MRALQAAVVFMGVLIIAGVATIAVVIVQRMSGAGQGAAAQAVLDEPAGTRIAGISAASDRLALQLQGGGPDRVVVLDERSGKVLARASLAR
jgi:hypothetical protein